MCRWMRCTTSWSPTPTSSRPSPPPAPFSGTVKVGTDSYSNTTVKGVSEVYFDILGYTIDEGRLLNYVDLRSNKKVCVVGDYINRVAYGGNAVGQTVKIGSTRYTIVSVLEAKVTDLENQEGSNDDMIFVPYTTALRVAKSSTVSSYSVTIADESKLSEGKTIFEDALKSLLHSDSGYMVTSLSEMLDTMTSMVNMVVTILTAIAAISLLVGGIGIMNIMMVSVTRAHPGDRHPQSPRRTGEHHPRPLRHRSRRHLGPRRRAGHRAGLPALCRGEPHPSDGPHRYDPHRLPLHRLCGRGLQHFGGHRRALRLPARPPRRTAEPH